VVQDAQQVRRCVLLSALVALHALSSPATHAAPVLLGSPYYNASHRAYRERVRAFVDTEVTPFCDAWDRQKSIPRELFAKAFAAGLLPGVVGPPWPEAYAGPGPEVCDVLFTRAPRLTQRRLAV
jgi:hypothetical protein